MCEALVETSEPIQKNPIDRRNSESRNQSYRVPSPSRTGWNSPVRHSSAKNSPSRNSPSHRLRIDSPSRTSEEERARSLNAQIAQVTQCNAELLLKIKAIKEEKNGIKLQLIEEDHRRKKLIEKEKVKADSYIQNHRMENQQKIAAIHKERKEKIADVISNLKKEIEPVINSQQNIRDTIGDGKEFIQNTKEIVHKEIHKFAEKYVNERNLLVEMATKHPRRLKICCADSFELKEDFQRYTIIPVRFMIAYNRIRNIVE
ncbi:hypothetical protein GPJ56_009651 [Histomonas meleagridis]|uniref:uncharacterized protein n=1 Tax=Histomonas meleagridis TaxID=135588 RepID=UPI00355A6130|nr:hypothetical protein GPJ56_009651 [Histomonas meleagridis]KAH0804390.1 hypothetical protein GO595_003220 [Histomonas meleagridis]